VVHTANNLAGGWADGVAAYTEDFAGHSPYLRRYKNKLHVIPPPVELPAVTPEQVAAFRERLGANGGPIIAMVARLATEKGVEVLMQAMPRVLEVFPDARAVFAGPYQNIMGEEAYAARIMPQAAALGKHWQFIGLLSPAEVAAFLPNCACITVPSLNSTETFGLVQIEAMLSGTPSVASDLPGVRQPVRMTGMGEVVPIGDSAALAEALIKVISRRQDYIRPPDEIAAKFSPAAVAQHYVTLFESLLAKKR
jgi:glycosyltransferase involved in cell wall biosynthesis